MQGPRIHGNGTGRARLEEQFERAGHALHEALEALSEAAPNARDYYVIDAGAFGRARDEHEARLRAVQGAKQEIEALHQSLFEGENERAR